MPDPLRLLVSEVHNFGGFFGGDTVTLSGTPWQAANSAEETLTIDQAALVNVRDRHTIAAGMLLELVMSGSRVDRAQLLAASEHRALRQALGPATLDSPLSAPQILSYHCEQCQLWVAGTPLQTDDGVRCVLCGTSLW